LSPQTGEKPLNLHKGWSILEERIGFFLFSSVCEEPLVDVSDRTPDI